MVVDCVSASPSRRAPTTPAPTAARLRRARSQHPSPAFRRRRLWMERGAARAAQAPRRTRQRRRYAHRAPLPQRDDVATRDVTIVDS